MTTDSAIADVLLPLALPQAYSYKVPEGMVLATGDYVEVPLGPRALIGVVWEVRPSVPTNMKMRDVLRRFDFPPMSETHRKFIDWLGAYYLEPTGNVLRMVLRVPSALEEAKQDIAYRAGVAKPAKLTVQRQRVLEVAAQGFAMRSAELADAAGFSICDCLSVEKETSDLFEVRFCKAK